MALSQSQRETCADRGDPTVEGAFQAQPLAAASDDTRGSAATCLAKLGPARMADTFEIALPYPRNLDIKTQPEFGVYTRRIYQLLGLE